MARPERFELPTSWFVAMHSIQLSYGRIIERSAILSRTLFVSTKLNVAEREGFEPSIGVNLYTLSRGALSATQPPLRAGRP